MLLLGAHMSISGGVYNAIKRGEELGCTAIQIFTKNARTWKGKPYSKQEIEKFYENLKRSEVKIVVAHNIYLVNLASENPALIQNSLEDMRDEMMRCDQLAVQVLVFHPGTHTNRKKGLKLIAKAIDTLYEDKSRVNLTLETTAGQGGNLGATFEEIAEIISQSSNSDKLNVCIDTCHIFAAGYELRTKSGYEKTLDAFDKIVGLNRLAVIHLNDSKYPLGSKRDRHEHIGKGYLGVEPFRFIINDSRFENVPKILETPQGGGTEFDKMNLEVLKKLVAK